MKATGKRMFEEKYYKFEQMNKEYASLADSFYIELNKRNQKRQKYQEELVKQLQKQEKYRKIAFVMGAVIVGLAVIWMSISFSKEAQYREVKKNLEEGNVSEAIESLEKLNGYKDTDELLAGDELATAQTYLTGKKYFENEEYIEAMQTFLEISSYEDSETYLKESAKKYLYGLWSDERETYSAQGFGFDDDEFYVWDLQISGLLGTEKHAEKVYEYPMNDYYVFQTGGQVHIGIECYSNGELVSLEFMDLSENSFECVEEEATFNRYTLD